MEKLAEIAPPEGGSSDEYAKRVSEVILDSYQGDVDSKTRTGAKAAATIFLDMLQHGKNVVTPGDVRVVAEQDSVEITGMSEPEMRPEIESWLPSADLNKLDPSYTDVTRWQRHEKIWVAPIYPALDDILTGLGNPPAVSLTTLRREMNEAFSEPAPLADEDYADRAQEVDGEDIEAFLAASREELEGEWVSIDVSEQDEHAWISPERIDEQLRDKGTALALGQVTDTIATSLVRTPHVGDGLVPDLSPETVGDLLGVLQEDYGWRRLTTQTDIWWYSEWDPYIDDYLLHANNAQEIVHDMKNGSLDELKEAHVFFEHNRDVLLREEDTTPEQLDRIVRRLGSRIGALNEGAILEAAVPGDNVETSLDAETPTRYHVAKKLEEKIEEKRDDDDYDDRNGDKGLSGYRY